MRKLTHYALALSSALAITFLGSSADAQGRYASAPAQTVRSSLGDQDLSEASPGALNGVLRRTAGDLGECQGVRRVLQNALSAARTAYDVHEDWVHLHEQCLLQREEDLAEISQRVEDIRQDEGDSRPLERLDRDLAALDEVLRDAMMAHDDLIAAFDKTQELAEPE